MRHAETVANVHGRRQGWGDSPLSEAGKLQSIKAGELMHGLFDRVLCSPLGRATETVKLMSVGVPVILLDELRERDWLHESDCDVMQRLQPFLCRDDLDRSLIVTHGRTARLLEAMITSRKLTEIKAFANTEVRSFTPYLDVFFTTLWRPQGDF